VTTIVRLLLVATTLLCLPPAALAQDEDPDLEPNLSQPEFTLAGLPTNLRLPKNKVAFRVTHRFSRPLGQGDFTDLLEDFFGLDSGAQIGLEVRYGLLRGGQVGVHRTSDRTIQMFAQYDLKNQRSFPVGIGLYGSIDGTNNFRDSYSPALGVVLSREFGDHGAVYFEPIWVNNTNPEPAETSAEDNSTFIIGVGTRLRIRPTVYVTAEIAPRVTGYAPGDHLLSFGLEKRMGGHIFSLIFANGFGTTMAQMARGGTDFEDWYIGFNIARKFY
jgi:hypothetical protein